MLRDLLAKFSIGSIHSNPCAGVCTVKSDLCDPMDCGPPTPLFTESSRPEYWSGLPFPTPGNLPDPGIEQESPVSPALPVDSLPAEPSGKP